MGDLDMAGTSTAASLESFSPSTQPTPTSSDSNVHVKKEVTQLDEAANGTQPEPDEVVVTLDTLPPLPEPRMDDKCKAMTAEASHGVAHVLCCIAVAVGITHGVAL